MWATDSWESPARSCLWDPAAWCRGCRGVSAWLCHRRLASSPTWRSAGRIVMFCVSLQCLCGQESSNNWMAECIKEWILFSKNLKSDYRLWSPSFLPVHPRHQQGAVNTHKWTRSRELLRWHGGNLNSNRSVSLFTFKLNADWCFRFWFIQRVSLLFSMLPSNP